MTTPVPAPVAGDSFVLDSPEGLGSGMGHIPNGSVVQFEAVHEAGTAGVGHAGEASVVLSHEHATHVITDEGTHAPGTARRLFSLHVSDFLRMFKKVDA
jgi:hypothetical protein